MQHFFKCNVTVYLIPPHGTVFQLEITVIIRDFFVSIVSAASATSPSMFLSTHIFMSHSFKQLLIELPGNKFPIAATFLLPNSQP